MSLSTLNAAAPINSSIVVRGNIDTTGTVTAAKGIFSQNSSSPTMAITGSGTGNALTIVAAGSGKQAQGNNWSIYRDDDFATSGDLRISLTGSFGGNTKFSANGTPASGRIPVGTDSLGNWLWADALTTATLDSYYVTLTTDQTITGNKTFNGSSGAGAVTIANSDGNSPSLNASSTSSTAVIATSTAGLGVSAQTGGLYAVIGTNTGSGVGTSGWSVDGSGVYARSDNGVGFETTVQGGTLYPIAVTTVKGDYGSSVMNVQPNGAIESGNSITAGTSFKISTTPGSGLFDNGFGSFEMDFTDGSFVSDSSAFGLPGSQIVLSATTTTLNSSYLNLTQANTRIQFGDASTNSTPGTGKVDQYIKGTKLVFAYNDSGTMRYTWIDLTSVTGLWTQSTSAP